MQYEFRGRTLAEVVRDATQKNPRCKTNINRNTNLLTKEFTEAWAPPLFWSPWYRMQGEIWTPKDKNLEFMVSFATITGNTTFDIEIAHGHTKEILAKTIGPGSAKIKLPRNLVTALYIRCRSHSLGATIDVSF